MRAPEPVSHESYETMFAVPHESYRDVQIAWASQGDSSQHTKRSSQNKEHAKREPFLPKETVMKDSVAANSGYFEKNAQYR